MPYGRGGFGWEHLRFDLLLILESPGEIPTIGKVHHYTEVAVVDEGLAKGTGSASAEREPSGVPGLLIAYNRWVLEHRQQGNLLQGTGSLLPSSSPRRVSRGGLWYRQV